MSLLRSLKYFVEELKMKKKGFHISSIRSDHRTVFENVEFRSICEKMIFFTTFHQELLNKMG